MRLLTGAYFSNSDTVFLAKDLLGKVLKTRFNGLITSVRITETEAYRGPEDQACHAFMNRYTERTKLFFEPGGIAYIYLCYGIHHLFNIVTGKKEEPHAILIRAGEPLDGVGEMLQRRGIDKIQPRLTSGPGSLSKALGILTDYRGNSITTKDSLIQIWDDGYTVSSKNVLAGPRVGIDYAGDWIETPWRFALRGSKFISNPKKRFGNW